MINWGEVVMVALGVAAVAAGLKGLLYLSRKLGESGTRMAWWWREKQRRIRALDDITSDHGWPNGSGSLKASHLEIYKRVEEIGVTQEGMRVGLVAIQLAVTETQRAVETLVAKDHR